MHVNHQTTLSLLAALCNLEIYLEHCATCFLVVSSRTGGILKYYCLWSGPQAPQCTLFISCNTIDHAMLFEANKEHHAVGVLSLNNSEQEVKLAGYQF